MARDIIKLGDRFAKYAKTVMVRVNASELKNDNSYMAKALKKLLDKKATDWKSHIKYCEPVFENGELTFEEKSLLARLALVNSKTFFFQLGWR